MKPLRLLSRFRVLLSLSLLLPLAARSQDTLDHTPAPANYGTMPMSPLMEPTLNPYGTVGMANVVSAEPLGVGRLGMILRGNFYQQSRVSPGTPPHDAQITTATVGAALGLNPYIDGFVGIGAYNERGGGISSSGAGSTFLGAQGSLPLPENVPIRLGLQVMSIFGTAGSQINTTPTLAADQGFYGYNYFETRKYTDLSAKLTQSLILAGDEMGIKLHLNEGVVSSFQPDKGVLLVTGAGLQFIATPPFVLGVEINDRTLLSKPESTDPLWVTPSMTFRTPAHLNVELGGDISLSSDRSDGSRTLEPWRAFGAVSFSFDTQADMKRRQAEQARKDAEDRAALASRAMNAEAANDSLKMSAEQQKAMADSAAQRQKFVADSLAEKARQDSLALLASQQQLKNSQQALAEERSKRSEAEKQLLSTGLLLLDAVYFETGKTDISINSKPYLNIIGKMLTKYPKLQIEVAGHTDNVGGMEYNMNLSRGRAAAVASYLIMVEPSLSGHLTSQGYGYTRPKADNSTAEGRKYNRRTELQVLNKEVLKEYNP